MVGVVFYVGSYMGNEHEESGDEYPQLRVPVKTQERQVKFVESFVDFSSDDVGHLSDKRHRRQSPLTEDSRKKR